MALLETRFYARAIDLSIGANIVLPEHPEAWRDPPAVLYLLHGLSGDHTSWCRNSAIERYVRDYNLVVVMPEANKSFYCDMAHGSDYLSFFTHELPNRINQWFKVSSQREKTFVAGSSMGGYGAVKWAQATPERFSHVAALSGALDVASHIHDEWDESRCRTFEAVFGALESVPGSRNDLIAELDRMRTVPDAAFYLCCGTEDYLYQDSVNFHKAAESKGMNVTYEESAGEHEWGFWDRYIQRVLDWLPVEKLETPEEGN